MYDLGDITISNFLLENGHGWNIDILRCVFWDNDVEAILRMPVIGQNNIDVRRWFYTKSGHYSVKSAYYLMRSLKNQRKIFALASTSSLSGRKDWSFIWKLEIPNKVRVFLWRILRNGLPVLQNLARRNICSDTVCPLCLSSCETILHVLQSCHFQDWCGLFLICHYILYWDLLFMFGIGFTM